MNIGAYEVIYEVGQEPVLGKPFLQLHTTRFNIPNLRELMAFEYFCQNHLWLKHDVSGLFSPRFTSKTGISAESVELFVINNPHHDVYLFHPYPRELQVQSTFLDLAEHEHPGISDALDRVWLWVLGRRKPTLHLPQQQNMCCHCNFVLATSVFWSEYSDFVLGFMHFLRNPQGRFLLKPTTYTLSKTKQTALPIAVFVFERALSHFIAEHLRPEQVVNYAFNQNDWFVPEVFPGEADFINTLKAKCTPPFNNSVTTIYTQKKLATQSYFFFRKVLVNK